MKQVLFSLTLLLLSSFHFLQANPTTKPYEETTWNVIRERLINGENAKAYRFEDDIRLQVIGLKTQQDSLIIKQMIYWKLLIPIASTTLLSHSRKNGLRKPSKCSANKLVKAVPKSIWTNLWSSLAKNIKKNEVSSIPIKIGDRVIFLRLDEVSYLQADEKYVSIVTKLAKSYILDSSLKKLEEKLPVYFIRLHKSYLVNKNLLKEIRKHFDSRFVLIMDDYTQSKITSGRSYFQAIKSLVEY